MNKKIFTVLIVITMILFCGCNRMLVNSVLNDMEDIVETMEELEEKYYDGKISESKYLAEVASLMGKWEKACTKVEFIDESDLTTKQYERLFEIMSKIDNLYYY